MLLCTVRGSARDMYFSLVAVLWPAGVLGARHPRADSVLWQGRSAREGGGSLKLDSDSPARLLEASRLASHPGARRQLRQSGGAPSKCKTISSERGARTCCACAARVLCACDQRRRRRVLLARLGGSQAYQSVVTAKNVWYKAGLFLARSGQVHCQCPAGGSEGRVHSGRPAPFPVNGII